jgi:hypothetical protein
VRLTRNRIVHIAVDSGIDLWFLIEVIESASDASIFISWIAQDEAPKMLLLSEKREGLLAMT